MSSTRLPPGGREDLLYLIHIVERIERVERYTRGGHEEFLGVDLGEVWNVIESQLGELKSNITSIRDELQHEATEPRV